VTTRRPGRSVLLALALASAAGGCRRGDRTPAEQLRQEIAALERERDQLRQKVDALIVKDPRVQGMPAQPVRVGIPTTLARELVEKVVAGFVDQVGLELHNLKVRKSGTVKKVVSIGTYELDVTITEIKGRLKTGQPDVRFGGNQISLALPVTVASGSGQADIHFKWDGKNVSGAVCGDADVTRHVTGGVKPDRYPLQGVLHLSATAEQILAEPRFPKIKIKLVVVPSEQSWAAVREILDSKEGLCGYVVDKVDVPKIVRGIVEKGFNVGLPTDKLKPVAVPVGIEPTMTVRGKPIALAIKVGGLAITEHTLWLGADVRVSSPSPEPAGP
jgi:hypothetical protein